MFDNMSKNIYNPLKDHRSPKQRDLVPGKKFRDSVEKWGEPTHLNRKRVIIAPNIVREAKEVDISVQGKGNKPEVSCGSQNGAFIMSGDELRAAKLSSDYEKYKAWVAERKKMRSIINQSVLDQKWLDKKHGKTPLERRVLNRMKRVRTPDIRIREVLPDVKSPEGEDPSTTGVDKGVPTIHQPSPAALAIIQEYLDKNRMRLVDLFAQADKDKNWIVSRNEFRNIIKSSKIPLSETDLEDLIMALDKDENDALDYLELATGRQAYLDEKIEKHSKNHSYYPTSPDHNEIKEDHILKDLNKGSDSRPTSPHKSPPGSPILKELPDSLPGSRPSSPSLLGIPATVLSEKVEKVSLDEMKSMRIKKQQKRKEREKAKQRKKLPEKPQVAASTLGGITGEAVDRYRQRTMHEYHETVNLCDMHGVQLSKQLLGRVLLQPEDKPRSQCLPLLKKTSYFTISSRHHIPSNLHLKNSEWNF